MFKFSSVSESLKIKARDGMTIHGELYATQAKRLIIFVHGLTADYMRGICKHGQEYFSPKGYDCFLINLYSDEIKNHHRPRALYDGVTLNRHIQDVQDTYAYFKDKYDEIFLVGHSYGGLTVALSELPVQAISLWDATYLPNAFRSGALIKEKAHLFLDWNDGQYHQVGQAIVDEGLSITDEYVASYAKQIVCPVQINLTSWNAIRNGKYAEHIKTHEFNSFGTDHNFSEPDPRLKLCQETDRWFEKHSNSNS